MMLIDNAVYNFGGLLGHCVDIRLICFIHFIKGALLNMLSSLAKRLERNCVKSYWINISR